MITTDKYSARCVAALCEQAGVRDVILSSGSRCAPLAMAMQASGVMRCRVVVDERQAAFEALGTALISGLPVALCCTSGSAMLNYAPAIAEAYYRHLPLIVITADRPAEWIDRLDGQTINQPGALNNIVKASFNLPTGHNEDERQMISRLINQALDAACKSPCGPVHINMPFEQPLSGVTDIDFTEFKLTEIIRPERELPTRDAREIFAKLASPRKVMVVCGPMQPDRRINRAINRLSQFPNVVVVSDQTANLHCPLLITNIDAILATSITSDDEAVPDVVITVGGGVLSNNLKRYLRKISSCEFIRIGESDLFADTFGATTAIFDMNPAIALPQMASALQPHRTPCSFASTWHRASDDTNAMMMCSREWSQIEAMRIIIDKLPKRVNLQLSNGLTVRIASLFKIDAHRIDANRGVNGIDGSTSTAIGAANAYHDNITLLLTGDMSARYDIGALMSDRLPDNLRIVIFDNDGGNIFRTIVDTRDLPVCESSLAVGSQIDSNILAANRALKVYTASDADTLNRLLPGFYSGDKCSVLVIKTSGPDDADLYKKIYKEFRTL